MKRLLKDKLIFFGLNEFNDGLLKEISNILPKNNSLLKLCDLHSFNLHTEDKYDSG